MRIRCIDGCYVNGVGAWAAGDERTVGDAVGQIPSLVAKELVRQGRFSEIVEKAPVKGAPEKKPYVMDQGEE